MNKSYRGFEIKSVSQKYIDVRYNNKHFIAVSRDDFASESELLTFVEAKIDNFLFNLKVDVTRDEIKNIKLS